MVTVTLTLHSRRQGGRRCCSATVVSPARSYLSACDAAFTIGIPAGQDRTLVTVRWPLGSGIDEPSSVWVEGAGRTVVIRAVAR
jgi:hypothetical protein